MEIQPQLAQTVHKVPRSGFAAEPKLDGARILIHKEDDVMHFYTRTGHDHIDKFPHIVKELDHFPSGTWLDGELVGLKFEDNRTVCDWGKVQSVLGSKSLHPNHHDLIYVAFDIPKLGSHDIRSLPYKERRAALEELFDYDHPDVMLVPQVPATQEAHDQLVAAGWEGTMYKNLTSSYASGKRGHGWYRMKATADIDAVIMDFTDGKNSFEGVVGAIVFGQYKDGVLVERGKCGTGLDYAFRKTLTENAEQYIGKVITVEHYKGSVTKDGKLRHPVFKGIREDKAAHDVEWHDE